MGRVSTLTGSVLWRCHGRSHPKACHRGRLFNRPLSPNRSNLAVLCRHGSHLVGQRPSTGLPARRKHGWSAAHIPLVSNGMWRNPIETHVCGRLNGFGGGSGRATDGGCVTERTRFTPAVNGGILSLIKDSNEQLVTNQLRRRNRSPISGIFLAAHSIRQTRVERQSIKSMAQREPDRF